MSTQHESGLSLLQVSQERYQDNPYLLYHQLRELDPVYWDEQIQGWVLTRYKDVIKTLRDPHFSAVRFNFNVDWLPPMFQEVVQPTIYAITRQMLFLDPPDHTRIRSLTARAFTPRVVESMRNEIQQLVDRLLDQMQEKGQADLMADFAYPLPAIVIAQLLGVPPEDRERFILWAGDLSMLLESTNITEDDAIRALYGMREFTEYFRQLIAQRAQAPRDDLLQALINAHEGLDKLSEDELLSNCMLLLAAGHGTTTHLLSNGFVALARHPEQFAWLKAHPDQTSLAVMELLRYDGPVQATSRLATSDLEIGGKHIQAGQNVLISLGAASHDPEQFADPDVLHLDRKENHHMAFGQGIHFCLGAPLARLEAEIAFRALSQRLSTASLVDEQHVQWFSGMVFRGVSTLPITFN
ncbi:cytochrome P450 [Ktedonospora formicarum]|uniref:Polyketide biosynthesis cytochrome P450 PksS n=1 Tax=Ktedonospora formicarum TaxID=2778364 RepID=A0A8J3I2L8_9CHLR|nr:cytochrome P450 [Ktedonospora formicarum]GHO44898.1 polyketide biosynthesis cytochrome P450 PksS [Ktedonospora formicarum]